jgi:hypothetical protein
MKIFKAFLLSLVVVLIVPSITHAREIIKEQNGQKCIDLEAVYADINDQSKALTGEDNSIDAVKKAQIISSLTNIMGILIGDRVYCVNDIEAASRTGSFENVGLLGQLDEANTQFLAFFPSVNVVQHLAKEFVPGYEANNSLLAADPEAPTAVTVVPPESEKATGKTFDPESQVKDKLADQFTDALDSQTGEVDEIIGGIDEADIEGDEMGMSGYSYLREELQLDIIWGFFRNIAYVFFIIIMIITGFMIMFRKELPGQVVVGISNTLPQIILGIILVTFSFAIVGIVMDIGKVSMSVISNTFTSAYAEAEKQGIEGTIDEVITVDKVSSLTNQALQASKQEGLIMRYLRKVPLIGPPIVDALTGLGGTIGGTVSQFALTGGSTFIMKFLDDAIEKISQTDWGVDSDVYLVDLIIDPIVILSKHAMELVVLAPVQIALTALLARNIILLLVCLYASFKVFITIITTYLKLFINVILAPIQIMIGSLPGNFSMTVNWFKSVVANVLVFVGIHLTINLFAYISVLVDPKRFNFFGNKGAIWPNWIISLEGVVLIGGYLLASNMPTIINDLLKVEAGKGLLSAGQSVKQSMSKIPLVGGMFGK